MSDGITFDIKGLDPVLKKMRALAPALQKKGGSAALRKGAAVVRKAAIANARKFDRSETPNKIFEQIVSRTNARKGKALGGVAVSIGIKGGAKRYVNNKGNRRRGRVGDRYEGPGVNGLYYWRFLEFGTSRMHAQPFMLPALEDNIQPATDAVVRELDVQIDKIIAKAGH